MTSGISFTSTWALNYTPNKDVYGSLNKYYLGRHELIDICLGQWMGTYD